MDDKFKIKSYGFGELAQMYFPTITKKSASAQLRKWIKFSERTNSRLIQNDYKSGIRILTPNQVKIIIDEFGEP